MRIFYLLTMVASIFVFGALSGVDAQARSEGIIATVNEDAITFSDLGARFKLVIVSAGLEDSDDIRTKLRPQVLGGLVDEQLMLQEAARLKLEVNDAEIEQGLALLAKQNKFSAEQFRDILAKSGVDIMTMERQIEAQISWNKVIQRIINPRVSVSDSDIDTYLARIEANKGKTEYLAAEIFLPVENSKDNAATLDLAQKIVADVRKGAPFARLAQQLSKAPGAQNGGSLGWLQSGQLSDEISEALVILEKGQVSDPIRSINGYHIVLMRGRRDISDETMPTRDEVNNMLGTERVDRMQKRHLLDLKSSAFIDDRG